MHLEHRYISYDPWLAGIFNKDVYKLSAPPSPSGWDTEQLRSLFDQLRGKPLFMYAKIDPQDVAAAEIVQTVGFRVVDTNVVFDKGLDPAASETAGCTMREATASDEEAVVALASREFRYSRFHLDPHVPRKMADDIKGAWVRNFFAGQRGERMCVATVDGTVGGFVLLLGGPEGVLTIDLIAVAGDFRNRGLAKSMIAHVQQSAAGFSRLRVGTQLANVPSVRLYEKVGFSLSDSRYVFHYHSG